MHVLNRALEKDPEERYQTVHEMLIDLRRLKKETTRVVRSPDLSNEMGEVPSQGTPQRSKKRLTILLVAIGALVCAGVLAVLFCRGPELNPDMKSRVVQIPFRDVDYADLSQDGNWIVFPASDDRGKFDVYMMNVAQGQPRRITHDSCFHIDNVSMSPDASTILYSRRRSSPWDPYEIISISSLGGTGRVIVRDGHNPAWMPGGQRFGYVVQTFPQDLRIIQLWGCNPDGTDRSILIADTMKARPGIRVAFRFSPDGEAIAWTKNFPQGYSEIMVRDIQKGTDRQLTYDAQVADDPLWSSTGHIFYSSNRGGNINLWMMPAGGGEPVQVTRGSGPDAPMAMTADGRRLMYSEVQDIGQVKIARISDGSVRQLTLDEQQRGMSSISPSGRYVAFPAQKTDAAASGRVICIVDRNGGNVRELTDDLSYKTFPSWSPDEEWITYSARPSTEPQDSSWVYLIQTDRPEQPRIIGRGIFAPWINEKEFVTWGFMGTHKISIDQPDRVRISKDSIFAIPVLNGKWVVGIDWRVGREGWWITSTASYSTSGLERAKKVAKGISYAHIPPGMHDMYYVPFGSSELHRISLPDGDDHVVRKFPGLGMFFSISGDGKEIAYTENYRKMRFVFIENVFH